MNAGIQSRELIAYPLRERRSASASAPSFAISLAGRGILPTLAGAVLGAVAAVAITATAAAPGSSPMINALAVVAAGIAFLAGFASVRDMLVSRAVLRTALAATAGVLAYAALGGQWALLGVGYTILLAWAVMEWLDEGHGPLVASLLSGLSVLALFSFGQI